MLQTKVKPAYSDTTRDKHTLRDTCDKQTATRGKPIKDRAYRNAPWPYNTGHNTGHTVLTLIR